MGFSQDGGRYNAEFLRSIFNADLIFLFRFFPKHIDRKKQLKYSGN